jgi:hypothetical protein
MIADMARPNANPRLLLRPITLTPEVEQYYEMQNA